MNTHISGQNIDRLLQELESMTTQEIKNEEIAQKKITESPEFAHFYMVLQNQYHERVTLISTIYRMIMSKIEEKDEQTSTKEDVNTLS